MPEERSPMPSGLRKAYDIGGTAIGPWDEALIEQRDWIFQHHLPLPMEF